MTHHPPRTERAFTLAETMIAVGILSMIGMLTYGVFARSMEVAERANRITGHYHEIGQAMLRMSREISMAFLSTHRDCEDPRTRTVFATSTGGGGTRLDFASFSHYKTRVDANESDQNELGYYLDRDPDDSAKSVLMRREQSRIDEEPDRGGRAYVLAHNIKELEFQFYDPTNDRWIDEWDSSRTDQKNRLPTFVSIKMVVVDPNGQPETFVVKTRVFLKKPIRIVGQGVPECVD